MTAKEYNQKYRQENREALRIKAATYYRKKREGLLEDKKFYYASRRREICRQMRDEYPTRREFLLAYNKQQRDNLRKSVMAMLGDRCACCDELENGFLEVDHIHGGGSKHVSLKGTYGVLRDVKNDPDRLKNYRILCSNCNKARARLGHCPHGNGI